MRPTSSRFGLGTQVPETPKSPWPRRLGALILALLVIWWLGKKPAQPPGYQRHLCGEAFRGAYGECKHQDVDTRVCDRIASVAQRLCMGSLPERYADPN